QRRDVSRDALGDRREDLLVLELDGVVLDALAQDREARREVGRGDRGDEAGLEARAEAFLERRESARWPVARQDELAAGLVERVEGVEELLLGLHLGGEELHVV